MSLPVYVLHMVVPGVKHQYGLFKTSAEAIKQAEARELRQTARTVLEIILPPGMGWGEDAAMAHIKARIGVPDSELMNLMKSAAIAVGIPGDKRLEVLKKPLA